MSSICHSRAPPARSAAATAGLLGSAAFRRKLALASSQVAAIEAVEAAVLAQMASRGSPGPGSSILKLQGTEAEQLIHELAVEVTGHYAAADQFDARQHGSNVAPLSDDFTMMAVPRYLNGRAASIYGGSNEVQRGIVAKAVLGL